MMDSDMNIDARLCQPQSRATSAIVKQVFALVLLAALPFLGAYVNSRSIKAAAQNVPVAEVALPANALWIDARAEADFAKEHIPGALNLNEKNWDENLARLFETWEPPRPILVYCNAGCQSSEKIAAKLTELGIEPVQVYQGGFEAWKDSHG